MNKPPDSYVEVPYDQLAGFVTQAAQASGLSLDLSEMLACMLTGNDLRGNFSHGSQQIATYSRLMKERRLNNEPRIEVINESPCSAVVDGDGGLGYFPSRRAMQLAIEKAESGGIAVTMSRNHGHFGAAGLYARMTTDRDLLSFVTSGHQLKLKEGQPFYNAGGGSPMAFSAPCLEEDHLVLDFGAMHDLYASNPHRDQLAQLAPGLVLRSIGLGDICQAWGGLLSGLSIDPDPARWKYAGANQGALFIVFRIDLFHDPRGFKKEMDEYVKRVRRLKPLPGLESCFLPGGIESMREREWKGKGIPVGPEHEKRLIELAEDLELAIPWREN